MYNAQIKYLRYILLGLAFLTLNSLTISAQDARVKEPSTFWNHVRFGGGVGLSFGNGFFSGTLAPSAIYEFNKQFAFGLGLNGTYNKRKDYYNSTILGGSLLALFSPLDMLQISAELEELNVKRNWDDIHAIEDENYWYPALFLGAGYRNGNITLGIRYDVLYDANKSVYADAWAPFVRVYF